MAVVLGNTGVLKPGRWRWARAIGWGATLFVALWLVFGLLLGGLLALELILSHVAPTPEAVAGAQPIFGTVPTLVALAAMLGCYYGLVRAAERRPVVELSPRRLPAELAIGLAIGFALMSLVVGTLWLCGWDRVTPAPVSTIVSAINNTLQSGILEETSFRLVVFRLVWRAFGIWPALAFSALLFGILHLTNPNASLFAALCIASEAGILLAAFYVLTGRAWMSIGVHAGWNFTQGWIWGANVSGTALFAGGPFVTVPNRDVPDVLAGAGFGPEATLAALVICTAAGLGVLWLAHRRGQFIAAD